MTETWKVEPDDSNFEALVIEQSHRIPVLVDFWAAWCGPCRMLGPILDKVVSAREGKLVLAKVDTEAAPRSAGAFRVQSIPAVYLIDRGEVVDGFQGVIPESQLGPWIDQRLERLTLLRVRDLEVVNPVEARQRYEAWLEAHPNDETSMLGLARLERDANDCAAALARLEQMESTAPLTGEAERLKAELHLMMQAVPDVEALEARSLAEPENWELKLQLARNDAAHQNYASAMERCLAILDHDLNSAVAREAKQLMLETFQVWGDQESVHRFRQRLSMLLF